MISRGYCQICLLPNRIILFRINENERLTRKSLVFHDKKDVFENAIDKPGARKMKPKLAERRRYIRIVTPLKANISGKGWEKDLLIKNISPTGIRFEIGRKLAKDEVIDLALSVPSSNAPILVQGKVVWLEKTSLEDNAPYDVGVEIIAIEEESKITLLKYLCDLLYNASHQ